MYKFLFIIFFLPTVVYSESLEVSKEEINDYDAVKGIGCQINDNKDITSIICKSKISNEYAWNAVMYRAKNKCLSQKFQVFFNKPPSLPEENGIYTAQTEIKCIKL